MLLQDLVIPIDTAVPMIIFWIISLILGLILIDTKLITGKFRIFIYFFTSIFAGVILGGIPNVLIPFERTFTTISERGDLSHLLHVYMILGLLLGSSFLFGRIFCGYSCPLGTFQELLSRINFKSDIKSQKQNRFHFEINSSFATQVRWIALGLLFFLSTAFSLSILPIFNPFSGFSYLKLLEIAVLIPFIILIIFGILSIFLYRPWCRFLCPFGAGSAFLGQFSAIKYRRTSDCTDCGLCEKVCPTQEAAADSRKGECYFCNRCIEVCPHDAITFDLTS